MIEIILGTLGGVTLAAAFTMLFVIICAKMTDMMEWLLHD